LEIRFKPNPSMKLILALLVFLAATAIARPLEDQEHLIKYASARYGIPRSFICAVLRVENGRRGSEAGINPITIQGKHQASLQPYCDLLMPCGAEQHVRLAHRANRHLWKWMMKQPELRAEWLQEWSRDFYCGGNKAKTARARRAANHKYFRLFQKVWKEQRAKPQPREHPLDCGQSIELP